MLSGLVAVADPPNQEGQGMKRMLEVATVVAGLVIAATGAAQPASAPASQPASQPASAPSPCEPAAIKRIDFKNFTYKLSDTESVVVKNGSSPEEQDQSEGRYRVEQVEYADVMGNGCLAALVHVQTHDPCSGMGNCGEAHWFLYVVRDGKPTVVWEAGGMDPSVGDRYIGQDNPPKTVRNVAIHEGALVVDWVDIARGFKRSREIHKVSVEGKVSLVSGDAARRLSKEISERERAAAKEARARAKQQAQADAKAKALGRAQERAQAQARAKALAREKALAKERYRAQVKAMALARARAKAQAKERERAEARARAKAAAQVRGKASQYAR